jgi:hypothetical protein
MSVAMETVVSICAKVFSCCKLAVMDGATKMKLLSLAVAVMAPAGMTRSRHHLILILVVISAVTTPAINAQAQAGPTLAQTEGYIAGVINTAPWPVIGGTPTTASFPFDCVLQVNGSVPDIHDDIWTLNFRFLAKPEQNRLQVVIKSWDGGGQYMVYNAQQYNKYGFYFAPQDFKLNNVELKFATDDVARRISNAISHLEALCGSHAPYDPFN